MTEPSYAPVPAGWYPDPRGSRQRRWWDGTAWTHALEPLAQPVAPAAPGYANLPGPQIRVPSPTAPTVNRALYSEARAAQGLPAASGVLERVEPAAAAVQAQPMPTRRQLRDAAAVAEAQRGLEESVAPATTYDMGPAVSSTQQPRASFAPEQFRTAEAQQPEQQLTEQQPTDGAESTAMSTAAPASLTDAPVGAAAQTLAPASSAPAGASTTFSPAAVGPVAPATSPRPVEPATVPASNPVLSIGPAYQPFGMTPKITTGTMEAPTSVNTSSVWLITVLPAFALASAIALIRFAPEFYTPFTQGALVFVFAIAGIALAVRDGRQLTLRSHQATASPAWIMLTPLAYLVARAAHTKRQAGRGWAPALVFVLLTAAATVLVAFSGLPIGTFVVV